MTDPMAATGSGRFVQASSPRRRTTLVRGGERRAGGAACCWLFAGSAWCSFQSLRPLFRAVPNELLVLIRGSHRPAMPAGFAFVNRPICGPREGNSVLVDHLPVHELRLH